MVNKLRECRADILLVAIAQTERLQMKASGVTECIRQIDRELAELRNRNLNNARLNAKGIMRPAEYTQKVSANNQRISTLRILMNEKYKGDALLQKTYITSCITKKAKRNNGELLMYYVENNHPAIIERTIFDRVQEEISRRNSKRKPKQVGTKTELGRYSSKYALSEILFCGDCGTPYRRCTWTIKGKKKIVWRCISRLDYGTKYCKVSPSIEETVLHTAIAEAVTQKAQMEDADIDRVCRHIELYQSKKDVADVLAKQERLKNLQSKIDYLTGMDCEEAQNSDFDTMLEQLFTEMYAIQDELDAESRAQSKLELETACIGEMDTVIQGMRKHPIEYDDQAVRQLIECIKVISAEIIHIYFKDGTKIVGNLNCP